MDPYLESPTHWSDFHSRFVNTLSESVNAALPRNYVARIDERVTLIAPESEPTQRVNVKPDVSVVRDPFVAGQRPNSPPDAATALLEPVTLENVDIIDPHTESYLKIIRLPEQELVT